MQRPRGLVTPLIQEEKNLQGNLSASILTTWPAQRSLRVETRDEQLHAGDAKALAQGLVASAERPDVSVSHPSHGTHTPIVERLEFGPEHLCQHPTLASVEQYSQHNKDVVDLAPGVRGERRVAQVGVKHCLLQLRKGSCRSLDPTNYLMLVREQAILQDRT